MGKGQQQLLTSTITQNIPTGESAGQQKATPSRAVTALQGRGGHGLIGSPNKQCLLYIQRSGFDMLQMERGSSPGKCHLSHEHMDAVNHSLCPAPTPKNTSPPGWSPQLRANLGAAAPQLCSKKQQQRKCFSFCLSPALFRKLLFFLCKSY